ncbi:conserved protein of unknown function [Kyrpidia spormannii]|uniref:Uncharacterized protein n=2 Tax=Kyrpidia spormannii TaxID=2055160 RepID=A0A6F9E359_9BACL|nr:conserved protein of unknown function [Kyrpidia spormannii]CAB3392167.1 conserved protein of unknown function [Kyrpidia spormannii]
MYYWLRKLRTNEKPQNPSLSVFPQWLPVEIDEKPIDLETPLLIRVNHVVVEVRSGCQSEWLADVVRALTTQC